MAGTINTPFATRTSLSDLMLMVDGNYKQLCLVCLSAFITITLLLILFIQICFSKGNYIYVPFSNSSQHIYIHTLQTEITHLWSTYKSN